MNKEKRMVDLLIKQGPRNIKKLAEQLSLPVETLRYKIKKLLEEKGFKIHAALDYDKLGLVRYWAFLDLSKDYEGVAVLNTLAQVGFLTYYCRTLPEAYTLVQFTIPKKFEEDHKKFLESLKSQGIFEDFRLIKVDFMRYFDFKAQFYDFKKYTWDVDWDEVNKVETNLDLPKKKEEVSFDKRDLLILKELQINAFRDFVDIARKVGIERKTLLYHYHKHIIKNKLITKYILRWTGDVESVKRYTILYLLAWLKTDKNFELVQRVFGKLPFIWSDSYSEKDGFYLAHLALPLAFYPDTLKYLQKNLNCKELKITLIDPAFGCAYTIPHHMFSDELGWIFEGERLAKLFKPLVKVINQEKIGERGLNSSSL